MTRIKTTKLVAIIMAVFMAFAFMSFSLTYVSAEDPAPASSDTAAGDNDQKSEETPKSDETPNAQEETPKAPLPEISFMKYTYGAPDVEVTIKFGNLEPEIDYESIAKNSNSQDSYIQQIRSKIISNIKVFKNYDENADEDKQFTNEINFGAQYNPNSLKYDSTNHIVTFTVPLNSSKTLSPGIEYYLWFGKDLNATKGADNGMVTFYRFTPNNTTTSSTSRTTTRTTYRTITTRNSTVRARSANTDDPSHLPVWIGLAAVSALMLGAVYFSKERD